MISFAAQRSGTKPTAATFCDQRIVINELEQRRPPMPYARARRFFLTPPSVPVFFISIALAILALLVTYGYVTAIRSS
jgi:hypothetical protein